MATACGQPNGPDTVGTDISIERLSVEPYSFEFYSGLRAPERQVIRDVAAWGRAWASIYQGRGVTPPLPFIDFTKDMIIVAALGERPTGGYDILLTGASRANDVITVKVEIQSPGSGCGVTLELTQPVDIAKMPRSSAYVQFQDTAKVRTCG
jgi:hypothetical protein